MTKSSKEQIKVDENKVIEELMKNARGSIDDITEKCGFSRQKLWRIMNRLDDNKTIWGYTAIVDDEKQKTKHYTVLIKRTNKPYNDDIIKKLTTIDHNQLAPETNIHILDSYYVHGSYDWILSFTSPGIKETKKFCDKLIQLYEGFISNLEIMETIVPIRKSGIKNPNIDKFAEFL